MHTYVHTHTRTCVHTHTHTHAHTHTHTHTHTRTRTRTHAHTHIVLRPTYTAHKFPCCLFLEQVTHDKVPETFVGSALVPANPEYQA